MIAVARALGVILVGAVLMCRRTVSLSRGGCVLVGFGSRVRGLVVVAALAAVFSVGGGWIGAGS
ncbi:hypothetical protein LTT66_12620 [Nocardia gipuzkoensis]|uniref:hypothetical protein n=1 Tax=Nocardia TaxID=1817 RepID=UPI001E5F16AF|nr:MULTISPECIES: hypothetical protein [Nocardia]UGT70931.1 hypothetical protein LTT66_12620 [Nocardia gipuzkoensis]